MHLVIHYFLAEFLDCCLDFPNCPDNAIQMGWAIWAAIKKYCLKSTFLSISVLMMCYDEVVYFSNYKSTYALDFHCWNYVRALGMNLIVSHFKYTRKFTRRASKRRCVLFAAVWREPGVIIRHVLFAAG